MKVYKEGFGQSYIAFFIVLGVVIPLLLLLNGSQYTANYSDSDRALLTEFIIGAGVILSVGLTLFLWLDTKTFVVNEHGLTIKSKLSQSFIDWKSIQSMATISNRYSYYYQLLAGDKKITIPFFKQSEDLLNDIIHYSDLEIHQENKFLGFGKEYRRWKKKGESYKQTSFQDSFMDFYYAHDNKAKPGKDPTYNKIMWNLFAISVVLLFFILILLLWNHSLYF